MTPPVACADAAFSLEIARDARVDDGGFHALSQEPWLRFRSLQPFRPGGFAELRYAANLYDRPVRPILRLWRGDEDYCDHILPAPCEGAGLWIGKIPKETTDVWISPTNRAGPFDFRILDARQASFAHALRKAAAAPKRLFFALSADGVGLAAEAELNWRWALGGAPISTYPSWRAARQRPSDPSLDRPRRDWRKGPRVVALLDARGADARDVDATRQTIEAQNYPHCALATVGSAEAAGPFEADDLLLLLQAGDRLEPHACACFVEHFARHPEHKIAYADETSGAGADLRPWRKPDWSATLHRFENYVGRAACFRARLLAAHPDWACVGAEETIDRLLSRADMGEIGALRRPLFHVATRAAPRQTPIDAVFRGATTPAVTIVIPTRDRIDLLAPCLESLLKKSLYPRFDALVVDNDSADPRTHALLARLQAADGRLKVLRRPGAFNFSALCNAGARATTGDYLIFLNNDTEIVTTDWIERLLFFAAEPDIGAVGAKLLYPNGRVQHAGVLLGMGGVAGHFGAGLCADAPGWLKRNLLPHEVSAVTGACLMVERRKFDAVAGFDEAELPVELNDVDLCLRLAARGWRAICDTQATLIHHQSASRGGGALRLQRVYEKERRTFCERWRAVIRDDPYFHPGLSLYANEERLP